MGDLIVHPQLRTGMTRLSLKELRCAAGMTRPEFARAICREVGWEFSAPVYAAWEECLHIPPPSILIAAQRIAGNLHEAGDDVRRRTFLTTVGAAGALSLSEPWERATHAFHEPRSIDLAAVDNIEQILVALNQLELKANPATLWGAVRGHLQNIHSLLNEPLQPEVRRRLSSLAGETAGLAGWLFWEMDDHDNAQKYFAYGLNAARDANDPTVTTYLSGSSYCQPAYRELPALRLKKLDALANGPAKTANRRTQAWLSILEAEAFSLAGQRGGCLAALDRAEALIAHSAADSQLKSHAPLMDQASLTRLRGVYLSRLGDEIGARAALQEGLASRDRSRGEKGQCWCLIALARIYARQGQMDAACGSASEALRIAASLPVKRLVTEVRQVRFELNAHGDEPALRDLDEQLRLVASA